jgi:hypothetical protein
MSAQITECLEIVARVLLRCWVVGVILLLFWWASITLAGSLTFAVHGEMFDLTAPQLNLIHYCGLMLMKIMVSLFFFIPWLAIKLVLNSGTPSKVTTPNAS